MQSAHSRQGLSHGDITASGRVRRLPYNQDSMKIESAIISNIHSLDDALKIERALIELGIEDRTQRPMYYAKDNYTRPLLATTGIRITRDTDDPSLSDHKVFSSHREDEIVGAVFVSPQAMVKIIELLTIVRI